MIDIACSRSPVPGAVDQPAFDCRSLGVVNIVSSLLLPFVLLFLYTLFITMKGASGISPKSFLLLHLLYIFHGLTSHWFRVVCTYLFPKMAGGGEGEGWHLNGRVLHNPSSSVVTSAVQAPLGCLLLPTGE